MAYGREYGRYYGVNEGEPVMQTTTLKAIRAALLTAIKAVTPTYEKYQSSKWRYIADPLRVPGSPMRTFTLTFATVDPDDEDGLFNQGFSHSVLMRVETSYQHLPLTEEELLIEEDSADLFFALGGKVGSVAGLIDVEHPQWVTDGESEDGYVYGAHEAVIRFFRRDR